MSWFTFYEITGASVPTPATSQASIFINSATGQPSYKDDTGTVTSLVGAVSITGWTNSLNTSGVNATTNVSCWLASGGSTNQAACIQPKGNGPWLAQLPDGTATGGDARGVQAFDGQLVRSFASEVAQGDQSVLLGAYSRAGAMAAVAIGYGNVVNDQYGASVGGTGNISGYCAFSTGFSNVSQGQYSFSAGQGNAADAENGWIPGGLGATTRGTFGAGARASGFFVSQGDCQDRVFKFRVATSNATQATSTTNGAAASTTNQIILPDGSAFVVKGTINVREAATGDSSAWDFTAYIKRGAGAGTTAMVAACTPTLIAQDAGAATWAVAVDADTTNGGLRCRVTGQASHDLKWSWSIYSCNEVVG